ncbi:MAG: FKBP-type peptidyl-prolyl cis-trans isomerase SlpA, partial [Halioglobus sp.]
MDPNDVPVSQGTRIFLNFSLSLEDGSEVDSNFGSDPVDFVYGDGSLLPGFEYLMLGMTAGQRSLFTVLPENAFGQPNDNNVQTIPRKQFDDDAVLEPGVVFSFADAAGGEVSGMLLSFDDEDVQ